MAIKAEGSGVLIFRSVEAANEFCGNFNTEKMLRGYLKKGMSPFNVEQKGVAAFLTYEGPFDFSVLENFVESASSYVVDGYVVLVSEDDNILKVSIGHNEDAEDEEYEDDENSFEGGAVCLSREEFEEMIKNAMGEDTED